MQLDFAGVAAAHPHFVFDMGGFEPFHPLLDDEGRRSIRVIDVDRHHHQHIRNMGVCDEALSTGQDVVPIFFLIDGPASLGVRSAARLSHSNSGEMFAACQPRQVLAFLFLRSEQDNRGNPQPTDLHHHCSCHRDTGDLLQGDQSFDISQAQSTIFLRDRYCHHFPLPQSLDYWIPVLTGFLHGRDMRGDLCFGKFPGCLSE